MNLTQHQKSPHHRGFFGFRRWGKFGGMRVLSLCIAFIVVSCTTKESSSNDETEKPTQIVAQQMPPLLGSQWSLEIADGVFNTYFFNTDTTYQYLSEEIEDTYYGSYIVNNDTLYLTSYTSSSDSLLSEDSPHRSIMAKQKLVAEENSLLLVWQELKYGSGWKELETPPNLYYKRVE